MTARREMPFGGSAYNVSLVMSKYRAESVEFMNVTKAGMTEVGSQLEMELHRLNRY